MALGSRVLALSLALGVVATTAAPAGARPQEFEARVDAYPPAKRSELNAHLRQATARLRRGASRFEVAAAINSYVFQRLRVGPTRADGVLGLRDGFGGCGGAATAMVELLRAAGIRSRHAALLGVSFQGNHALVQAYFSRGRAGLFDPTFGTLWYSRGRHRPVRLARLLADPSLSARTLFKSVGVKRIAAADPIVPIPSFDAGYRLRPGYAEHPAERGRPHMDWMRAFAERGGAGLANSGLVLQRIRLRPGDVHGNPRWDGATALPWDRLVHSVDRSGLKLPWPDQLGVNGHGYSLAHSYRLRGLAPGRRYRLTLFASQAPASTVTASIRRGGRLERLDRRRLAPIGSAPAGTAVPTFTTSFTARHAAERVRVSAATGFVRLQAIRFEAR